MAHPVMWFEVLGTDGGKLRQFYGDLFGWTFDVTPPSDYGVAKHRRRARHHGRRRAGRIRARRRG